MPILAPFARPLFVMAKPVGSLCNQQCDYCYYLDKQRLYPEVKSSRMTMSDETLEAFIRQYIEAQTQPQVLFTWHGGEPLLRPLSFYRRVIELQQQYAKGRVIDNCLQTNGTLLNDEWCQFFRQNKWLIGISIDGPQELHDAYRHTRHGGPSFEQVMRGIHLLQKHGVEWNAMGVVNKLNAEQPLAVYHFYKEVGCRYIQFTPIVEGIPTTDVIPGQYANFCKAIFDEWVCHDVGNVFIQLFDSTLACWVGEPPGVCSMGATCGHVGVIEHNGDVYSCDHFVFPRYLLGNIHQQSITSMMYGNQQRLFGQAKRALLPHQCLSCKWLFACQGGCPKDRIIKTELGEDGLNYLCNDYRDFFAHVAPYMDFMKNELLHGQAPARVMEWAKIKQKI